MRLPTSTTTDKELVRYAKELNIPNFRGVKMRDELPAKPRKTECGILNLETSRQTGSHWVAWHKDGKECYYFDSFAEPPPLEIMQYLKTHHELILDIPIIKRNAVTVQHDTSNECGSLCLFVLKHLSRGDSFSSILETLQDRYHHPRPLII